MAPFGPGSCLSSGSIHVHIVGGYGAHFFDSYSMVRIYMTTPVLRYDICTRHGTFSKQAPSIEFICRAINFAFYQSPNGWEVLIPLSPIEPPVSDTGMKDKIILQNVNFHYRLSDADDIPDRPLQAP